MKPVDRFEESGAEQNQVAGLGRLRWKWQESVPQRLLKPSGAGYLRHG
jgi:hypothetical protein